MLIYVPADSLNRRVDIHRQRGSVMLLTVVSLLMLAILGMAYLQTTRLDRATASTSTKSYIDMVSNATIAYIGEVLKNDLISTDGVVLDKAAGIEVYDYPWTNTAQTYTVKYNDGSTATAQGGSLDDTWLASTEPTFTPSHKGTWDHITNLNGTFLRIPSSTGSITAPEELAVDNTTGTYQWRRDTGVPINVSSNSTNLDFASTGFEKLGADADGDGIEDSKWTWAPIRQVSGVSYVMATRIIDNSALLNLNVALSQVKAKDNYDGYTPLTFNPSALDFGNFLFYNGGNSTALKSHLAYRLGTSPITLPNSESEIYNFWTQGAMLYDNYANPFQKLGILNELELRYRNGLNNPNITSTVESSSNGLEDFLRATETGETRYSNVSGVSRMDDYFAKDVRHQLTTVSGASVARPALPNETPGYQTRHDLYSLLTPDYSATTPNNQTAYSHQLQQILYNFYLNHIGYSTSELETLSKQMAVNMLDYVDTDNKVSCYYEYDVDGNPVGYSSIYGNEALPYITEVYTQRSFKVTAGEEDHWVYIDLGFYAGWWNIYQEVARANADSDYKPGIAIEIRNPYQNDIPLTDVYLWIGNDSTGYSVSLDSLAGGYLANRMLKKNQILILYSNSSDDSGIDDNDQHDLTKLCASSTSDHTVVKVPVSGLGDYLFVNSETDKDSNFSIQLRATNQSGSMLNWGYSKVPVKQYIRNPGNITLDSEYDGFEGVLDHYKTTDMNNKLQFTQTSTFAIPQGLNALAYQSSEWQTEERDLENLSGSYGKMFLYPAFTIFDRLGQNDKSDEQPQNIWYRWGGYGLTTRVTIDGMDYETGHGSGATYTCKFDPSDDSQDTWNLTNMGTIDHIGDLLLMPIVGMRENMTFAASLAATTKDDDLRSNYMLDENSSVVITTDANSAYQNMNYALALLEQFVVRSPESDGLDNDADGLVDSADDDELLIPGTINLNTATAALLNQILPISDTSTREDVVNQIVSLRSTNGIPTRSDLFYMSPNAWGASSTDRADMTSVQRMLGSVANTRSDIYTAYVVIRGYPAGDFRKGVVEARQFFVVFDRSKIKQANDKIQILGYYEFE